MRIKNIIITFLMLSFTMKLEAQKLFPDSGCQKHYKDLFLLKQNELFPEGPKHKYIFSNVIGFREFDLFIKSEESSSKLKKYLPKKIIIELSKLNMTFYTACNYWEDVFLKNKPDSIEFLQYEEATKFFYLQDKLKEEKGFVGENRKYESLFIAQPNVFSFTEGKQTRTICFYMVEEMKEISQGAAHQGKGTLELYELIGGKWALLVELEKW